MEINSNLQIILYYTVFAAISYFISNSIFLTLMATFILFTSQGVLVFIFLQYFLGAIFYLNNPNLSQEERDKVKTRINILFILLTIIYPILILFIIYLLKPKNTSINSTQTVEQIVVQAGGALRRFIRAYS